MRASSVANEIVTQQVEPIEAAPVMGTYSALRLTPGTTHVDRSTHYLTEARSHYTTSAVIVAALAVFAGVLALAIGLGDVSLPFITPRGFMLTGGALLLTATWLYSEGRVLERRGSRPVPIERDRQH